MYALILFACAASTPFQGPGIAPDGGLRGDLEGPFVVAVTHARPNRGKASEFNDQVDAIEAQLQTSDGLVGYSLRGEVGGRDRWTLSIWESDEALIDFLTTGAHLESMARAAEILESVESGTWTEADPARLPPSWAEGLEFLDGLEGHGSR